MVFPEDGPIFVDLVPEEMLVWVIGGYQEHLVVILVYRLGIRQEIVSVFAGGQVNSFVQEGFWIPSLLEEGFVFKSMFDKVGWF